MTKYKRKSGLLPNWVDTYIAHPFAYGGDQAMGDLFGDRGILKNLTHDFMGLDTWRPDIESPEGFVPELISEIPRGIITSGGLLGANSVPRMVLGGGIAGAARDPQESMNWGQRERLDSNIRLPTSQNEARLKNAIVGAAGAGIGGVIGHGLTRGAEKLWQNTIGRGGRDAVREYGSQGNQFAGAKKWHSDPQGFEKALGDMPTARGTITRGVRPNSDEAHFINNRVEEGDIYDPGRAMSADRYGHESFSTSRGGVNEFDEVPKSVFPWSKQEGPMIFIKTNNARDASGTLGWQEIMTLPSSKFKVTKMVRDADGNVTELYLEDLSNPGFLRTANDVVKEGSRLGAAESGYGSVQTVAKPPHLRRKRRY